MGEEKGGGGGGVLVGYVIKSMQANILFNKRVINVCTEKYAFYSYALKAPWAQFRPLE